MYKVIDIYTFINKEKIFSIFISGVLIGLLSLLSPITILSVILFISTIVWLLIVFYRNLYSLIDIPFLILLTGTFAFGRAFSVLGFKIECVPVFVTEIALIATLGFILAYGRLVNFNLCLPKGLGFWLFVYLIIGTIYLFMGLIRNNTLAFRDIVFCHYMLFLFLTIIVFNNQERIRSIFLVVIPSCIIAFLVGVAIIFELVPEGSFLSETRTFNLSLYYGLSAIFSLSFFYYIKRGRILLSALVLIYLGMIILLRVRTGWIAAIVGLAFFGLVSGNELLRITKRYLKAFFLLIPIAFAILIWSHTDILSNITNKWYGLWHWNCSTEHGANIVWRFAVWENVIGRIKEHPFLGWGFGEQLKYIPWGKLPATITNIGPGSGILPAHNYILAITFKMGLLGLLLFLFINVKIFFYGLNYIKKCKSEFNRRFLIAGLTGLVYWHTMALFFDVIESPPTSIFLWILLGLVLCVVYIDKNEIH